MDIHSPWFVGGGPGRGALMIKTGDQTLADSTQTQVTWDATEYDDLSLADLTNNRFVIPVGVSWVRLTFQVTFEANGTSVRLGSILKNATSNPLGTVSNFRGGGSINIMAATQGETYFQLSGAMIQVVPGDYFTCVAQQNSTGNLDVIGPDAYGPSRTWFGIEVIR